MTIDEDRIFRQIVARLSLRKPQIRSLEILRDTCSRVSLDDELEVAETLATVREEYPLIEDFERDFPSLCFALATGVGKTRLMGAFVSYLFLTGRSKNFFVLAPNTTIYEKLIADFTPNTPKYVFRGIAEFVSLPPIVVTGDTWDQGRGVRGGDLFGKTAPIINIFNVDKINKEAGRIKKLHEYIGQSYFDYLAGLPDLVLLMDEAHRYRAAKGMKAVSELQPVLGLELTATPKTVGSKSVPFKNVIYHYRLAEAMADGYVKEPAVATRKDFDPRSVGEEELERIKLEDGVHYHEYVKVELDIYARQTGKPKVHPFMLVVAQDTTHAKKLREDIESDQFFDGRYKGRVAEIHSALKGEESDDATARLVALEKDGATEIVIHVNKLKEGWDVTNLYTIVPLRSSASDILTEQTLGRGLRLPYGTRTGVEAVDTLTVIAHDRFQQVIDAAKAPGSIVHVKAVEIGAGGDVSSEGAQLLETKSHLESALTGSDDGQSGFGESRQAAYVFQQPDEIKAAEYAWRLIQERYEPILKRGLRELNEPEVKERIAADVRAAMTPAQGTLDGITPEVDIAKVVGIVADKIIELTIEIPEIVIIPNRQTNFGFQDFELEGLDTIAKQPISNQVLIQNLRNENRKFLALDAVGAREERLENYLVRYLVDEPQVDYGTQAELLYKLAGQMVTRLKQYLPSHDDVENVLLAHGRDLARFIFEQMRKRYWETPTDYRAVVSRGFKTLRPQNFNAGSVNAIKDFRLAIVPLGDTRKYVFGGFQKCCYPRQRFQSNEERVFAVLVDGDHEPSVMRWMKPGPGQLPIEYSAGESYDPDFVVETTAEKLIVEIKRKDALADPIVVAKARAATKWVGYANAHAQENAGKPWHYLLVPHDAVLTNATLGGLVARYAQTVQMDLDAAIGAQGALAAG